VIRFDWDPDKAIENDWQHGVSFDEAETAVNHALSRTVPDLEHSSLEERFRTIGWSDPGRLLVVVTSEGGLRPRIISAWRATKRERDAYEQR
jgi:uncharacterized DUF497 family protein